ncbi:putative dioxygenase [Mycobacteroides stephanolepidis]|uniref:Putative dioxygenase n=1 Tax=[Mycobacterium] stephanolepidis TaxID=1520670 RepID=A0A1Z4F4G0_9MYCO|nr:alpha/beta hydrolase [[Mycobacterium] stephanolepidis]BAY00136.1 putative dioxygenase [[Mycobacterium] stephanolepidis]
MYTITVNGAQLTFDDQGLGDRPAILLLTGWGHDHRAYDELLPYLVPHHRIIRMDWRGHGTDRTPVADFILTEQVSDVIGLLEALSVKSVVPVAHAHAGWAALEIADRLGATRVPSLVIVDLIMTEAPLEFLNGIREFQDPQRWQASRLGFLRAWLSGSDNEAVIRHIRSEMGGFGFDVWARAGRVIEDAYATWGSPLSRMEKLSEPRRVHHIFCNPQRTAYDDLHQEFQSRNPWFSYVRLPGTTHFPQLELPAQVAAEITNLLS